MKPHYDLIVFDWDGTLMDSVAKIVRCFENALADAGAPSPGAGAIRYHLGMVYAKQGKTAEARRELEEALKAPAFAEAEEARKALEALK